LSWHHVNVHYLLDRIMLYIQQHPGQTASQIAEALFGPAGYHQRVGNTLRLLCIVGRIERRGSGGPGDPFKYYPGRMEPPPDSKGTVF
jgi:hypothetical protein